MTDADEVAALLDERPDLEPALRRVLAVDREHDTWTFDDLDVDSGSFGELVSKGVVEKVDGEYRLDDPDAVARALDAERAGGAGGEGSAGGRNVSTPDVSLSAPSLGRDSFSGFDVDRVAAGTLVALLAFTALLRSVSFPAVFRDRVVLSGNDPYFYRYWVEQLLAQAGGSLDLSVLSNLPSGVADSEPLMVVTLWFFSTLFGGTAEAAGVVLALYPVVSAVLTGGLVYLLALRVSDDRRIALAAVALFAIVPAHALRTSLGFADHHAFDYPWLVLTALSFVALLRTHAADADGFEYSAGDALAAVGLGVGIAGQVLAWQAGPLLVLPLGLAVAAVVPALVRRGASPLPFGVAVAAGVGLAALLTALFHVGLGWQSTTVASTPALLLVGVVGVVAAGEAFRRLDTDLPAAALVGAELAVAVLAALIAWVALPELYAQLGRNAGRLFSNQSIVEVQSLFSGGSLDVLLLFGFVLLLGVPYMAWGVWYGYRRDARWLAAAVYGWYFLALAAVQLRFSGELSAFVAVFAGLGFVHLAERVDITDRPRPFQDSSRDRSGRRLRADGGRLAWPDRTQLTAVVVLFLLVGSLGLVQVPIKVDQLSIPDGQYRTAQAIDAHAAEQDLEYPQNYVYSDWGRNRMYNYFVNGEAQSYILARQRFDDVDRSDQDTFIEMTDSAQAYDLVDDRPGYLVLERQPSAPDTTMQARLFRHHGSKFQGVPGLAHYQLVHVSEGEDYKAFRIVEGARITGPAEGETVSLAQRIDVSGTEFTYERSTVVRHGVYSVQVPYPGTYEIGGETVEVTTTDVEDGRIVEAFDASAYAHYSFDEGSGDRAYDRAGGYHGTLVNASWTDGREGSAVQFTRKNASRVRIDEFDGPNGSFTVSMWVNPSRLDVDGGSDYRHLVATSTTPMIILEETGQVSFRVPGVAPSNYVGGSVPLNEWTHVAVTYDGERRAIYVDGEKIKSETVGSGTVRWRGALLIGSQGDVTHTFSGSIDDVRIYDRALDPSEIGNATTQSGS